MRTIGITGGVGGGKSQILAYLKSHYNCEVILADEVAHRIKEPGERCYKPLVELLGEEVLAADKRIDKGKMAEKIFRDKFLLEQVNRLMHPMVKEYILEKKERLETEGQIGALFIEAALLIEDGYEEIVDELWYIYASEEARKASDERISEKMKEITSSGTQIVTVGEELWEEMREASRPVYGEIEKAVKPEIIKAYKE